MARIRVIQYTSSGVGTYEFVRYNLLDNAKRYIHYSVCVYCVCICNADLSMLNVRVVHLNSIIFHYPLTLWFYYDVFLLSLWYISCILFLIKIEMRRNNYCKNNSYHFGFWMKQIMYWFYYDMFFLFYISYHVFE